MTCVISENPISLFTPQKPYKILDSFNWITVPTITPTSTEKWTSYTHIMLIISELGASDDGPKFNII